MSKTRVVLPGPMEVVTAPKYQLRWPSTGLPSQDECLRCLERFDVGPVLQRPAGFGTNAIELIPPRSDDKPNSALFPLPPMQMPVEMSRLADAYGLDVWIWYSASDSAYSDPKIMAALARQPVGTMRLLDSLRFRL